MAGDELKVDPTDLTTKAATVEGIPWGTDPTAVGLSDPDKLSATAVSVQNLVKNAAALGAEQNWGQAESKRLAETLRLVAKAYQDVDEASRNNIDATIPGGTTAPSPAPVPIGQNATPPPPAPPAMAPFANVPADGEILDPIETDNKLTEGDQAASLRAAATEWTANAARLTEAAIPFEVRMQNWEGVAAEAAYAKFKSFGGWLQALAGKWTQLAAEAEKLAIAHDQAKVANAPIRAEYEALQTQLMTAPADGGARRAIQLKMEQLYQESETIRETYANGGRPTPVQPPQPRPDSVAPNSPVTGNGDPRGRGVPARTEDDERRNPAGAGGQPQSSGGSQPAGGAQQQPMPQEAPTSPMGGEQASQAAQQGGQQGGGQQGGGQQGGGSPGGGSPGGGSPGGGMPTTGKGPEPKLPADPSLKPAAAGGSSGGGGGGGGGGVPSAPLQPAVGAETVAPTPVVPGAPIPVASAGSGGGGAMGGGVGGMAPMHGAHGGGAGERKRNPQLSPDEPLYVEDRPHTEQVIGIRPRRRGAPEEAKRGETS